MKLPKSLPVMGRKVKIVTKMPKAFSNLDPNNYHGLFFTETDTIWIHDRGDVVMANKTLIHELCHAVFNRTGVNQTLSPEVEEIICESIANTFSEFIDLVE